MGESSKEDVLRSGELWWKCRFELVKDDGLRVIRPSLDSQVEFYDPLKEGKRPEVQLSQAVDAGQFWAPHVHLARVKNEEGVLEFANRWGLLGLWGIKRYRTFFPDEGKRDWFRWEFPPGVKPSFASLVCRQEPVEVFLVAAEDYQTWLSNLEHGQAEDTVSLFELEECSPKLSYSPGEGGWNLAWGIDSLYSAIFLRTALDLAGGSYGFRRCKWTKCGRFFLAKNERDVFCSFRCQNNYFATRSKEKRKGGSN